MIMITKANVGICRVTEEIVLLIAIKDIIEIDWRVGYLLKLKIIIRKYLNFQYWKTYIIDSIPIRNFEDIDVKNIKTMI